ncbi:MAG: hypothetical protein PUF62_09130 [Bacteroidales bacterium]|nr:hypothetical protein [Bacteroidales bacterium]
MRRAWVARPREYQECPHLQGCGHSLCLHTVPRHSPTEGGGRKGGGGIGKWKGRDGEQRMLYHQSAYGFFGRPEVGASGPFSSLSAPTCFPHHRDIAGYAFDEGVAN